MLCDGNQSAHQIAERVNQATHHLAMMSLVPLPEHYKGVPVSPPVLQLPPLLLYLALASKVCPLIWFPAVLADPSPSQILLTMRGFNLAQSNPTSEFSSFKRSAKAFKFKKASLNIYKSAHPTPRCPEPRSASTSTPSPSVRADTPAAEFTNGDDVICISREVDASDSSSVDEISPDELQTPSSSPYASSYSTTSSSSCHLPPEIDDRPVGPTSDEYDPRRASGLSMVSSWIDHHLQELDLAYSEDGVYEVEIVTTPDGFPSRRDSFILPPGETFQSFHRKRTLPVVPPKQLSRPLPSTPPTSTNPNPQSRPIRPLPPPPSPW